MKYIPHNYQTYATDRIIGQKECALLLEMGLGKTVCTLTAINELVYDRFEITRVLVIAPKRVALDTWMTETEKWDHLNHLKISRVLGTVKERKSALHTEADIYVINRENVTWLVDECRQNWMFDMIVIDELSSFKSNKAKRFKSLKQVRPLVSRIVGLTGTPSPNGLMDLWSQIYLLDRGERLGKTIGGYRARYFSPLKQNGHIVYSWGPKQGAEDAIYKKLEDLCVSMKAKDYLELPEMTVNDIHVSLDTLTLQKYQELEKEKILELDGTQVTALTAATVYNKLLQMANGFLYDDNKEPIQLHNEKAEALKEIMEAAQGKPVLVFYNYRQDYKHLKKIFKSLKPRTLETQNDIQDWNAGRIPLLLAQPASMGHGLNLQTGGHIIVWYGLNWSLELYQQANARLYRQGQTEHVVIHRLIAKGTVDEEVINRLESKGQSQESLMEAVKAKIRKYKAA